MEVGGERNGEHGGRGDRAGDTVYLFLGNDGVGVVVRDQHAGTFSGGRVENNRDGSIVAEERRGDDHCRRGRSGGDLLHRVVDRAGVAVR